MPIRVDAYTAEGIASGTVERPGALRETLENATQLELTAASWQAMGQPSVARPAGVTLAIDDVLLVTSNDDPFLTMHAAWHAIRLEVGPYLLTGELPTLPGFDPGRALTRPSGEFVLLRDVRLAFLTMPEQAIEVPHVLVNRYGVDRVDADLMLGFFFPGAVMDSPDAAPEPTPASSAAAASEPTPAA